MHLLAFLTAFLLVESGVGHNYSLAIGLGGVSIVDLPYHIKVVRSACQLILLFGLHIRFIPLRDLSLRVLQIYFIDLAALVLLVLAHRNWKRKLVGMLIQQASGLHVQPHRLQLLRRCTRLVEILIHVQIANVLVKFLPLSVFRRNRVIPYLFSFNLVF